MLIHIHRHIFKALDKGKHPAFSYEGNIASSMGGYSMTPETRASTDSFIHSFNSN